METADYRKMVAKILKASTKIAMDHRRGPANFVRVPDEIKKDFPEILAGIEVHGDASLNGEIVVGRLDGSGFLAQETINLNL